MNLFVLALVWNVGVSSNERLGHPSRVVFVAVSTRGSLQMRLVCNLVVDSVILYVVYTS